MAWTFTSSGAAVFKAGNGYEVSISGTAAMGQWSDQSEGFIVAATRKDFVTDYDSLPTAIKNILDDISSSYIAKQIIAYDSTGYLRQAEQQTLLNVQDDIVRQGINILKDFKAGDIRSAV